MVAGAQTEINNQLKARDGNVAGNGDSDNDDDNNDNNGDSGGGGGERRWRWVVVAMEKQGYRNCC